jgi:hypothetical protein
MRRFERPKNYFRFFICYFHEPTGHSAGFSTSLLPSPDGLLANAEECGKNGLTDLEFFLPKPGDLILAPVPWRFGSRNARGSKPCPFALELDHVIQSADQFLS